VATSGPSAAEGLPPRGAAAGLNRLEDWRRLLSPYSHIVLVANSTAVDVGALRARYPATTLFVFFNKVYKVLGEPFEGHALLVSRGQPRGATIVYRGEVEEVLSFFERANFLGIMNIRLNDEEKLNSAADFANAPTGHLDLLGHFDDFYTGGKTPTSGFAIAIWLSELRLPCVITLAGFSALRKARQDRNRWRGGSERLCQAVRPVSGNSAGGNRPGRRRGAVGTALQHGRRNRQADFADERHPGGRQFPAAAEAGHFQAASSARRVSGVGRSQPVANHFTTHNSWAVSF
jgi:hypothetical protein